MDFKSILSKLDNLSAPPKGVEAPKQAEPIRLDEGTELRVLAGVTQLTESVIAEKKLTAGEKKKKEEVVKSMKKDEKGFSKRYGKRGEEVMHATATKIAKKKAESVDSSDEALEEEMKVGDTKKTAKGGTITKTATGIKHTKNDTYDGEDHQEPTKKPKKTAMTGAERREQKAQDKKQADDSKAYAKKNPGSVKRYVDGKLVKEGNKLDPVGKEDDDVNNDGKKNSSDEYLKKRRAAVSKAVGGKKAKTKESLSFVTALKVVKESRGQFQIDPMDEQLWAWAERVGKNKFTESVQAQAFAAATYERMGGEWGLHKVLAEDKKKLNESVLDEGAIDKIKSLVPKFIKFIGADKAAQIANQVKSITGGDFSTDPANAEKVAQAFGFDKIVKDKEMSKEDVMGEAFAGNWQGKLVQFLYLAGLGGAAAGASSMWGTVGGSFMAVIGTLLIMFAATFFDDDRGMVGAMGKHGNKGFSTDKGPLSGVHLSRGDAGPLD